MNFFQPYLSNISVSLRLRDLSRVQYLEGFFDLNKSR